MDAAQWTQQQVAGLGRPMEEIQSPNNTRAPLGDQKRGRPQKDQNLNCPRCNSTNTKFCYYNNYSLTQPRYFCKTCRRYWTQGGSLRNVPVGGGSRKNKRSSSSSTPSSSSSMLTSSSSSSKPSSSSMITTTPPTRLIPDLNPTSSLSHLLTTSQNPKFLEGQDLNLAFPIQGIFHQPIEHQLPKIEGNNNNNHENNNHEAINNMNGDNNSTTTCTTTSNCGDHSASFSALELLRSGIASRGSLNSYVPMPMNDSNALYTSGFPNLQEFKPSMSVFPSPSDHHHHHHHHHHGNDHNNIIEGNIGSNARLLFPFADMNKLASSTTSTSNHHHDEMDDQSKGGNDDHHHHNHHHHHQGPTGYWTGMLGGGTW